MAIRTITDSVPVVSGPPENLPALNAAIQALEGRFPGVIFRRYLGAVPTVTSKDSTRRRRVDRGRVRRVDAACIDPCSATARNALSSSRFTRPPRRA